MGRRLILLIIGVLPATLMAVGLLVVGYGGIVSKHFVFGRTSILPFAVTLAGLSGTAALWIYATRDRLGFRSKRDAYVLGAMLGLGVVAASPFLLVPSWEARVFILCPIAGALSLFPAFFGAITPKSVREKIFE